VPCPSSPGFRKVHIRVCDGCELPKSSRIYSDVEETTAKISTEEDLMSKNIQTGDTCSDSLVAGPSVPLSMKVIVSLWSTEGLKCLKKRSMSLKISGQSVHVPLRRA